MDKELEKICKKSPLRDIHPREKICIADYKEEHSDRRYHDMEIINDKLNEEIKKIIWKPATFITDEVKKKPYTKKQYPPLCHFFIEEETYPGKVISYFYSKENNFFGIEHSIKVITPWHSETRWGRNAKAIWNIFDVSEEKMEKIIEREGGCFYTCYAERCVPPIIRIPIADFGKKSCVDFGFLKYRGLVPNLN